MKVSIYIKTYLKTSSSGPKSDNVFQSLKNDVSFASSLCFCLATSCLQGYVSPNILSRNATKRNVARLDSQQQV